MAKNTSQVDSTSLAYEAMAAKWDMLDDLLGGTAAMREAATKWLPQEPAEEQLAYECRLARSVLYNAYSDTIEKLSAKPFTKPITITNLPDVLKYLETDVDKTGRSLTQLGKDLLHDMVNYGKTHLFPDFSYIPQNETDNKASIEDEKKVGARAILTHVSPENLISWQTTTDIFGNITLIQIVIREVRTEADGTYGDKTIEYYKVVHPGDWERWQKVVNDKGEVSFISAGSGKLTLGYIPLITIYAQRTGYLTADPPLEDLAWLNITHWQSMSDQRNILRFARFGILFGKGFTKEEVKRGYAIGPSQAILSSDPNADLKYAEHNGAAIGAGEKDLESLENRMEILGLQPMAKNTAATTATGKNIDEARNNSSIQAWIRALETGLRDAIKIAAEWHRITLADMFALDIFSDFAATLYTIDDLTQLLAMRQAKQISQETYLKEIKRRGVLSEDVDIPEEIARTEQESPGLGDILAGDMDNDGDGGGDGSGQPPVTE